MKVSSPNKYDVIFLSFQNRNTYTTRTKLTHNTTDGSFELLQCASSTYPDKIVRKEKHEKWSFDLLYLALQTIFPGLLTGIDVLHIDID